MMPYRTPEDPFSGNTTAKIVQRKLDDIPPESEYTRFLEDLEDRVYRLRFAKKGFSSDQIEKRVKSKLTRSYRYTKTDIDFSYGSKKTHTFFYTVDNESLDVVIDRMMKKKKLYLGDVKKQKGKYISRYIKL